MYKYWDPSLELCFLEGSHYNNYSSKSQVRCINRVAPKNVSLGEQEGVTTLQLKTCKLISRIVIPVGVREYHVCLSVLLILEIGNGQ